MKFHRSLSFARLLDRKDPLRGFRKLFHIPLNGHSQVIYFTGNSLGLQPVTTTKFILGELESWRRLGVEGHFHGKHPWLKYHQFGRRDLARLVGARPAEVVAMNQLTVNLHLMLTSFYRPSRTRFRIIAEAGAFSSDQYAIESHIRQAGFDPAEALIEIKPREGKFCLETSDILSTIESCGDSLSLVLLGAVQYYTGQFFNISAITKAAHHVGALAGFDLAHAIGNVPLKLHDADVDFAVWCGYKYLNSGPGGIAGAYVHERHGKNTNLPRLAGWWGYNEQRRFEMAPGFIAAPGVDGWQVSNFPVLSGAPQLASLEIFKKAGMPALRRKSVLLTGFLEFLLSQLDSDQFEVITPTDPKQRGCQLSILMRENGRQVFDYIIRKGVSADWRERDVIRVAPVPLYNTFTEVYRFVEIFSEALSKSK